MEVECGELGGGKGEVSCLHDADCLPAITQPLHIRTDHPSQALQVQQLALDVLAVGLLCALQHLEVYVRGGGIWAG